MMNPSLSRILRTAVGLAAAAAVGVVLSSLFVCTPASAMHHEKASTKVEAKGLSIENARAMATRPGQPNGGAFIEVQNTGPAADRLVGFSLPSSIAKRGELHTMATVDGMMRMREVPGFDIPAGGRLVLQPGADHLMLMNIQKPLQAGDTFDITLRFEKAGEVKVPVKVMDMQMNHGGHGGMKH